MRLRRPVPIASGRVWTRDADGRTCDGEGYPDRLASREIPLSARIVAACDAYDAMTSDRPYRGAVSQSAALQELNRCAGSQFDPAVVRAINRVVESRSSEWIPLAPLAPESSAL